MNIIRPEKLNIFKTLVLITFIFKLLDLSFISRNPISISSFTGIGVFTILLYSYNVELHSDRLKTGFLFRKEYYKYDEISSIHHLRSPKKPNKLTITLKNENEKPVIISELNQVQAEEIINTVKNANNEVILEVKDRRG